MHDSYCADHAKALCDGVDRRGMGHLVWAHSGRRDERGEAFNPLDVADTALVMLGTRSWGLRAVLANPEGTPRCVCCEADRRYGSGSGRRWIDQVLDTVRQVAASRGLVDRVTRAQFSLVTAGG